ncbi:MAG: hypothetical protein K6G67_02985 [Lachnospiraceae bacterium]|nr:hypothetical protein [Lachnospiraceae bacterium]
MMNMVEEELLEKVAGGDKGWHLLPYFCRGMAVLYNGDDCEVLKAKLTRKGWVYDIRPYWWIEDVRTVFYNVPEDQLKGDSD